MLSMTKAICLLITDLKFRGLGCFLLRVGCGTFFFFPSPKIKTEMQNKKANHHTSSTTLESF